MPAKAQEVKKEESKIQFFGEIDLNDQGGIKSDMPAWYLERHIEYMEEDIARKERQIQMGTVDPEVLPRMREEVKAERKKLRKITDSKPNLTDKQRDRCFRAHERLGKHIQDTMPTRKQTKDGLVDPYNEMKRMKTKHVPFDPELAAACGAKPVHGKITGDEANKCYQILGKAIGESTSVEALRRDGNTEAYQTMHDLTQAILQGKEIKD